MPKPTPTATSSCVRGAGRVFCGGGDLTDLVRAAGDAALQHRMVTALQDAMFAFAASRLVVIAAVGGAAAGAGLGLVLNADIVLASTRASFHGAYGAIGLTPDAGRLVPAARSPSAASAPRRWCSPGRRRAPRTRWPGAWSAEVLEPDALDARADELAARLVAGPTQVLGPTKKLLSAPALAGYRAHLDDEAVSITSYAAHPDTQTRIRALIEKAAKSGTGIEPSAVVHD